VYWTEEILDLEQLANGKVFRQIESKAFNPNYTFTSTTEQFSLGEVGAPVIVFGNITAGTVNRTLVEYLFGKFVSPTISPLCCDLVGCDSIPLSHLT
jgi:hypothetical protein